MTIHVNIYTTYHCFPVTLTLTYIPHTIVSQMKNSLTPGFSLQIYLKLRIPHKKYAFPQDTVPSTLFFLVNTAKDTYVSSSSKHWDLTPHHFLEKGFNMVNPLDSSQSSFHLWRFLLSTSSFFRMTIFYFFHTSMIIFFLLVQLLVLQMQVLYEVSSLDFFLSQQFCLDDPAFSNRLKHHLCIASF